MSAEVNVTNATFNQEVLEATVPVLADFWAEWCVPCRMVAPVLEELAEEHKGKLKVAKINVDQESDLAAKFNIVSIPTILLFHQGQIAKQQIGAAPRKVLEEMIKEYL
jgi:thioredoxin 1